MANLPVVDRKAELCERYSAIKSQVATAAQSHGQTPPRLVAVSKYMNIQDIQHVYDAGHRHFGMKAEHCLFRRELCPGAR